MPQPQLFFGWFLPNRTSLTLKVAFIGDNERQLIGIGRFSKAGQYYIPQKQIFLVCHYVDTRREVRLILEAVLFTRKLFKFLIPISLNSQKLLFSLRI
jgi:hypothetical protein